MYNKTNTMNKEFLKMQKIAGLITENQMREMMDDDKNVQLTPEVKQYIDEAIAELRKSQSDEKWAGLERAEFWGNDFAEGVWLHFEDEFEDSLDVSKEVKKYIFKKVAEYDKKVNEMGEGAMIGDNMDQIHNLIGDGEDMDQFLSAATNMMDILTANNIEPQDGFKYLEDMLVNHV